MNQQGIAFTQVVGETITYEQDVVNDTISSATWTVDVPGATLSSPSTSATKTTINFSSALAGIYVLTVALVLASEQVRIGQGRITVIQVNV